MIELRPSAAGNGPVFTILTVGAPINGRDGDAEAARLAALLDRCGAAGVCIAADGAPASAVGALAEALDRRRVPFCLRLEALDDTGTAADAVRRASYLGVDKRAMLLIGSNVEREAAAEFRRRAGSPVHLVLVDAEGTRDPFGAGFDAACDDFTSRAEVAADHDGTIDAALRRAPTDHPRYRCVWTQAGNSAPERRLEYWLAETIRAARQRPAEERVVFLSLPANPDAAMLDAVRRAIDGTSTEPGLFLEPAHYRDWQAQRSFGPELISAHQDHLAKVGTPPFTVIVLFDGGATDPLAVTIRAAAALDYPACRLRIVAPTPSLLGEDTDRLTWLQCRDDPLATINSLIHRLPPDEWVWLLAAGDRLAPRALLRLGAAIAADPAPSFLYCDDEAKAGDGNTHPRFKPDFNLDLLRSSAYVGRSACARAGAIVAAGGFVGASLDNAIFDLLLKIHDAHGSGAISHFADILLSVPAAPPATGAEIADRRQSIAHHLQRIGQPAEVLDGLTPGSFQVAFRHPRRPLVSIIVPTRDQLPLLQRCIETLAETTSYDNYEILVVDNASRDPEARAYLDQLGELAPDRIRVLAYPLPFNFSAMNNLAAKNARGEYLLLLNNDTAALHPDWLDNMMAHAQRADVGVVGARLLYQDGTLQHAGVVVGLCGFADHQFTSTPMNDPTYMDRGQVEQNLSAVTGACLLVRKQIYDELGGLDESHFKVLLNDIDFCLRVREAGHLVVWTPHATLLHDGSASLKQSGIEARNNDERRQREAGEMKAFTGKWIHRMGRDPAYNVNLSLKRRHHQIESDPIINWNPLPWNPLPRVLTFRADAGACSQYRILSPLKALSAAKRILGMCSVAHYEAGEIDRIRPDVIVLQRQMKERHRRAIARYKDSSGAFRVFEIDDLITRLPEQSANARHFGPSTEAALRESIELCDRLVVSSQPLADAYGKWSADVRVVPNFLDRAQWGGLTPSRRQGKKPRVGWAGAGGHEGDLRMLAEVIRSLANEVEWVLMGICPDDIRPLIHEVHGWSSLQDYPDRLAALNLDVAIAPLESNLFNEAKSNIKLLEYGVLGYPVICSDVLPYQDSRFPVTRVKNTAKAWASALREHAADLTESARRGDQLKQVVTAGFFLDSRIDEWQHAWLR